jgi:nicotinate-nucleotide adenylyltransferase
MKKIKQTRIGIYSGTFDPVHTGHVAFALQAMKEAGLDRIVFLPERNPRRKAGVEHFGHRTAMLSRATKPYPNMSVLELTDKMFTVAKTLPQLQALFPDAQLVMLMGSDAALHIPYWQYANRMLESCELVVGVRSAHQLADVWAHIGMWQIQPQQLYVVESFAPHVSSSAVREALRKRKHTAGLLASVRRYARGNWLYISLEKLSKENV